MGFHTVIRGVKRLYVPIYGCIVYISFNSKCLSKYLKDTYKLEYSAFQGAAGLASVYESDDGSRFYSVYVDKEDYSVGVLSHECVHCAWDILNDRGIELSADNHESLTYLVGWLAEEINKYYKTGK